MDNSWLKLYRKILNSDMYKHLNSKQRDVMTVCLLKAGHKNKKWEYSGEIFETKPGQFITSLKSLKKSVAKDTTIQNIRTALVKLEKWQFLTNKSTKQGRLVTIIKWESYQGNGKNQQSNQQRTNKGLTTNKNVKNVKNGNTMSQLFSKDCLEYKIATYLQNKIMKTNQAFKQRTDSQLQNWCTVIDRLIRIDNAKPKEVKQIIDWIYQDDFWSNNILSARKLREHYPRLWKKAVDHDSRMGVSLQDKIKNDRRLG